MWTVQEAKAKLSNVLKRARDGEPQIIGAKDSCVVIAMEDYERITRGRNRPHLGRWLVENAPQIGDLELPPRSKERPVPFDDWSDEDFAP